MAETGTVTGSRSDLVVDASRCLRMRYSESSCRRCIEICPHGAVQLEDLLSIDPDTCRGCLLCTTVCPVGALEQQNDFHTLLLQLSGVAEPVLGCIRSIGCSHGTVACLGGLSEEHLVTLYHTVAGSLTFNISPCGDCPNNSIIFHLKQRLESISESLLSHGTCHMVIAESAQDVYCRGESLNRRGFFRSLRNSLLKGTSAILSDNDEPPQKRIAYSDKRVPVRRKLLNSTREKLSTDLGIRVRRHFDVCISFENICTKCQGCVAICPTGALQVGSPDGTPAFDHLSCTGCGLCSEFCADGALRMSKDGNQQG